VFGTLSFHYERSGTDVMIFKKNFAENFGEKMAFLTQNKAKFCKNLIIILVFEKTANFFAKNCHKSQKIVIITSTPGLCTGDQSDQMSLCKNCPKCSPVSFFTINTKLFSVKNSYPKWRYLNKFNRTAQSKQLITSEAKIRPIWSSGLAYTKTMFVYV
jgi:hypothetical protein